MIKRKLIISLFFFIGLSFLFPVAMSSIRARQQEASITRR